jgi:hypothetical protein
MPDVVQDAELSSSERWMTAAGVLVAAGAAMMLAKGVLLIATGHDRSLVPWFSFLSSVGLIVAAVALWRAVERWRWL